MIISKRVSDIETSPIRKLIPYEEKALEQGKRVYHLNIGQPDLETPKEFFESVKNFNGNVLEYEHSKGKKELIGSMIEYYKNNFGIEYNYEDILVTTGGSEALLFSLLTIFDEGDEILVSEPYYANYNSFFNMLGIKVKAFTASADEGFHLPSKEKILEKITDRTRAIIVTNPGNPTGVVYREDEINLIAEIAKEKDLYIISDEVYRVFAYDDRKAISFGEISSVADNVIIIDSISKTFSSCGARIGAIISKNKKFISEAYKLCQARLSVSTLDMVGAESVYKLSKEYFLKNKNEYEKRRDIIYSGLQKIDGVKVSKPEGAFYVIVTLPVENSEDFSIWMLENFDLDGDTVMVAPAKGFYASEELGKNQVRISYCIEAEKLERSMKILAEGLKEYNK